MKAIVCIKEVPETPEGVSATESGRMTTAEGASFLTDPIDPYTIETALQLRDQNGGEVIGITVGEPRTEKILKEALAMGVDQAYRVSDGGLAGGDPHMTARLLAAAARKVGGYDLIVVGDRAADDNSFVVGPALAQILNIPILTFVGEIVEFDYDAKRIRVARALERGKQIVEASLPALLSIIKGIYEPRYPSLLGIRKASKREVPVWSVREELGEDPERLGVKGPSLFIRSLSPPPPSQGVEMIDGEPEEMATALVQKIMDRKIL